MCTDGMVDSERALDDKRRGMFGSELRHRVGGAKKSPPGAEAGPLVAETSNGDGVDRDAAAAARPLSWREWVKDLLAGQKYKQWVSTQRLPVDCLYCLLFILGCAVVFRCDSGSRLPMCFQPSSESFSPVSIVRWVLFFCHLLPIAVVFFEDGAKLKLWYVEQGREWLFCAIRLAPVLILMSPPCSDNGSAGGTIESGAWLFTCCLWVGAYQVSLTKQIVLQSIYTVLAVYRSWKNNTGAWPLLQQCGGTFLLPVAVAFALEVCVSSGGPEDAVGPTPSGGSSKRGKGESSETVQEEQPGVSSPPGDSQPVSTPREKRPPPKEPKEGIKLKVDIRSILTTPPVRPDERPTFWEYEPKVHVRTRAIKVKGPKVENVSAQELGNMSKSFYREVSTMTRSRTGSLTVVKSIAVRGCVLFIAEVIEPRGDGDDDDDHPERTPSKVKGKGESYDLQRCLPPDLRDQDLEVMLDGHRATFTNGELRDFNLVDLEVDLPEVTLVRPPCVDGGDRSLDVYMSAVNATPGSTKLVVVVDEDVRETKVDNQHLSVKVTGDDSTGAGYLTTVSVVGGGTFVGSLAPFLMLTSGAAAELNDVFSKTITVLKQKEQPNSAIAVVTADDTDIQKKAWTQYFKGFALDMHYLVSPDDGELWNILEGSTDSGNAAKCDFLRVFVNVFNFLQGVCATQTLKYLLDRFEKANITLAIDEVEITEETSLRPVGNPAPGPSEPNESRTESKAKAEYNFIRGFKDPVLEGHYRHHFNRNQVLMDLAGMTMGLCLLPVISVLGERGRCLYLCPLVMHLRLSLLCVLTSSGTYISNREPIVMLSWGVRTVAWLGQSLSKQDAGPIHFWQIFSYLIWSILVKPQVLKVPYSMHLVLGLADAGVGICGLVLNAFCQNWSTLITGPIVVLIGLLSSLYVVYRCEKSDRDKFYSNSESRPACDCLQQDHRKLPPQKP